MLEVAQPPVDAPVSPSTEAVPEVGTDAPALKLAACAGSDTPTEPGAIEMKVFGCPQGLLDQIRRLDAGIKKLQADQNLLLTGFMVGKGFDTATHTLNVDLDTGCVTVTPR